MEEWWEGKELASSGMLYSFYMFMPGRVPRRFDLSGLLYH